MSAGNTLPHEKSMPEIRAWVEDFLAPIPVAEGVTVEPVEIGGNSCEFLRPQGADPSRLVFYAHGGGWVFGSPRSHRVIASNLARASGVTLLSVQYRCAPEHPAPAAHDDVFAAYTWALSQGYAAESIAVCGDSAGGNMALATALRARDEGVGLPAALFLMSPALDLASEGASHREITDSPLVDPGVWAWFLHHYVGDGDRKSPVVAPLESDLSGLPPVLIHVGSWEMLLSDSKTLAEKLGAAGGDVELKIWEGMCHNHQFFAPFVDEGMASLEEAGAFLKARLA